MLHNASCVVNGALCNFFQRDSRLFVRVIGLDPSFPCAEIDTRRDIGPANYAQFSACRLENEDAAFVLLTANSSLRAFIVESQASSLGLVSFSVTEYAVTNNCGFSSLNQGKFMVQISPRKILLSWTGGPEFYTFSLTRASKTANLSQLSLSAPIKQTPACVPLRLQHPKHSSAVLLVGGHPGFSGTSRLTVTPSATCRDGPYLQMTPRYCTSTVMFTDRFVIGFGGKSSSHAPLDDIYVYDLTGGNSATLPVAKPGSWRPADSMVALAIQAGVLYLIGGEVCFGCFYMPLATLGELIPDSSLKNDFLAAVNSSPVESEVQPTSVSDTPKRAVGRPRSSQPTPGIPSKPEPPTFVRSSGPLAKTETVASRRRSQAGGQDLKSQDTRSQNAESQDVKSQDPAEVSPAATKVAPSGALSPEGRYRDQWNQIVRQNSLPDVALRLPSDSQELDFVHLFASLASSMKAQYAARLHAAEENRVEYVRTQQENARLQVDNQELRAKLSRLGARFGLGV